jgi:plastocyanin
MRCRSILTITALLACGLAGTAAAETFIVEQVNPTFAPDDLTINLGDTVEWHWNTLAHTGVPAESGTWSAVRQLFR